MTEFAQDFEVFQGDAKEITIPITDEFGVAVDLTGSSQRWQAHEKENGPVVITKADANITIVSVAPDTSNAIRFSLVPADTQALEAKDYDHEAEIVDASANPSTVTRGTMTVRDDLIV